MSEPRPVHVDIQRLEQCSYLATNERGGTLEFGCGGEDTRFTPVELLLAAVAGCASIDVDLPTSRQAEPERFDVRVSADRIKDDEGSRVTAVDVRFSLAFPEGAEGDRARAMIDRAIELARTKLCTVSRSLELGTPVSMGQDGAHGRE